MSPRPNVAARLAGLKPCGCTTWKYCEPHWLALTDEERSAHRRRIREGTQR